MNTPPPEEVDLCKSCNTMKHLNSDGLCSRCVPEEVEVDEILEKFGFDLSSYKIKNKRQVLRNCVEPELGLHILNSAPHKES